MTHTTSPPAATSAESSQDPAPATPTALAVRKPQVLRARKRPLIVEAVQWWKHGDHDAVFPLTAWRSTKWPECGCIQTLEGMMIVSPGDYIIKGVKGEHWPIKPDIFEATYDIVTEND